MEMKCILFVDDETFILEALKRMLRSKRHEWEMHFLESARQALDFMEKREVDVLVSDMRMPGMDGSALLQRTKELYPKVIRIILSGHSDLNLVIKSVLPAHQYLSKPCESDKLKSVIERTIKIRDIVSNDEMKKLIASVDKLPVLPKLYREITDELKSPDPSIRNVGKIIACDVAMTAKILNLVNSSFFGFTRHISSPEQAVTLLGINIIKSLVLSVHIFSLLMDVEKTPQYNFQYLWEHSFRTSNIVRRICASLKTEKELADDACIAGLLHDVGKIVYSITCADKYDRVLAAVRKENRPVWEMEKEILGFTHAEAGACLMGLWGLPDSVVEAIAFHHSPFAPDGDFRPLTAVHAADVLDHGLFVINESYAKPSIDLEYLGKLNLVEQFALWEDDIINYFKSIDGVQNQIAAR